MSSVTGIRADLVARFKRQIEEKTYRVKSEEIAGKMAQKLKEDETYMEGVPRRNRWTS